LTLAEREEISRAVVAGQSIRSIAARLGRAPSTISREVQRNGGRQDYRASQADALAWDRARRPKTCKLVRNRTLAQVVASKLRLQWSPEQIAGWLKHVYAVNKDYQVSHETIYRSLYIQARGALKRELLEHLRRSRAMRRSRQHTLKSEDRTNIRDAISISERPGTAEDRAIPGHWEGDLLFGNANSQIATLVERQTRFVMLVKISSKDSEAVVNALIRHAGKLPQELYKSLTWDRGTEMAGHKRFTIATDIKVYFCDPQHPCRHGCRCAGQRQSLLARRNLQGERHRTVSLPRLAVHEAASRCNRRRLRGPHAMEHACHSKPLMGVVKRPHTLHLYARTRYQAR